MVDVVSKIIFFDLILYALHSDCNFDKKKIANRYLKGKLNLRTIFLYLTNSSFHKFIYFHDLRKNPYFSFQFREDRLDLKENV